MSAIESITKDILFDRYGDVSFANNDLDFIDNRGDILYQNVLHRLISNFGDWKNYPDMGANFSGFIGKPVNAKLEDDIRKRVEYCLTSDDFLSSANFSVTTLASQDRVLVRVNVVLGTGQFATDRFVVNTIFNSTTGLLYASTT